MSMTLEYPRLRLGGPMWLVDVEVPSRYKTVTTIDIGLHDDFPYHVGLCATCGGSFDLGGHGDMIEACPFPFDHQHLVFECDDGTGMVPAPVMSRAMIEKIFNELHAKGTFDSQTIAAMRWIALDGTPHLPAEFTPEEREFIAFAGNRSPHVSHAPTRAMEKILERMKDKTSPFCIPFFEC